MLRSILQSLLNDRYSNTSLVYRLLTEYGLGHWRRYALAFLFMAIAAACTALSAYLVGSVINEAYVYRNLAGIVTLCFVIVFIFAAKGLASYGQHVVLARIANSVVAENQRHTFDKLAHESVGYFANRHSADFMGRLSFGARSAAQVLNLIITAIGRDALTLIGLVIVMLVQDPLLSLVGLIVAPPAFLIVRALVQRVRGIAMTQFTGSVRILETMLETIQGIRVVKAFALEDVMRRRVYESVDSVERAANKMARVANRSSPLMEFFGGVAIATVFLYSGYRVLTVGATPGEFFSFLTAFLLAYEPAKRLARLNIELASGLVGVRVLFEMLDAPATEPDDSDRPPLQVAGGRIEFSAVEFAYRPGEPVLRRISFVAEPGRVTALVGLSGGGKSTVFNLLLRFYETERGSIAIDRTSIRSVSRRSLRRHIAYVGQEVFLFRGSIRDNIAFGRPGVTEEEIVAAAKAAHAHDFIMSFPKGYDSPVGEHGAQLSGGQRQRIAIARALIKDAPIILLDEATAALDSESELLVQEALRRLCENRTTLVIAHRLHTILHSDCIHVVEDGVVVESGRHEELLRRSGRYASFYRLQVAEQGSGPSIALASSA